MIRKTAKENRLLVAERIRGELLKLGFRVSKRTVQRYMKTVVRPRSCGQSWLTFFQNHGENIWACDFLQSYDRWFRPVFSFFLINVGTREVVSVGATRTPTSQWAAQQLGNVTPFGNGP